MLKHCMKCMGLDSCKECEWYQTCQKYKNENWTCAECDSENCYHTTSIDRCLSLNEMEGEND